MDVIRLYVVHIYNDIWYLEYVQYFGENIHVSAKAVNDIFVVLERSNKEKEPKKKKEKEPKKR